MILDDRNVTRFHVVPKRYPKLVLSAVSEAQLGKPAENDSDEIIILNSGKFEEFFYMLHDPVFEALESYATNQIHVRLMTNF